EAVVVGRDDDVAVDSLALREPPLNLREVLGVRVDLFVIVDLDPRFLLELLQCRRLVDAGGFEGLRRVDVVRPVREVHNLLDLAAARRTLRRAAAARRHQTRDRERSETNRPPPQELVTSHSLAHSSVSSFACSTTNVESGLQLNVTFDPGGRTGGPAPVFCAKTWTVPASVSTTTCVATPIYAVSTTLPSSSFSPPP